MPPPPRRPRLAGRLAEAHRRAVRGRSGDRRTDPGPRGRVAHGTRGTVPGPPAVSRPGVRARRLSRPPLAVRRTLRFTVPVAPGTAAPDGRGDQATAASCPRLHRHRDRPRTAGRRRSVRPRRDRVPRFADGESTSTLYWMAGTRAGCSCRSAMDERIETYGAGRYLLDTAKGADLGGDPAPGRSSSTSTSRSIRRAPSTRVVVSAGSAGEPPPIAGRGGRRLR